jgi:hypothetical protein
MTPDEREQMHILCERLAKEKSVTNFCIGFSNSTIFCAKRSDALLAPKSIQKGVTTIRHVNSPRS